MRDDREESLRASKITSVDFFDDLASPYARRRFFFGFTLICVISLATFVWMKSFTPPKAWNLVVESLSVSIFTSSFIILVFYMMYVYFVGEHRAARDIRVVRPSDIGAQLSSLTKGASEYKFWGRTGSYFRSEPLLKMDRDSTIHRKVIHVQVLLPNPNNANLMSAYADILSALGESRDGEALSHNVLATTAMCAIVDSRNRYMDVSVYYSNFLPNFRIDLSDRGAVLTQDDKDKSALFFSKDGEFFNLFRATVATESDTSSLVKWDESMFRDVVIDDCALDASQVSCFGVREEVAQAYAPRVSELIRKRGHRYK